MIGSTNLLSYDGHVHTMQQKLNIKKEKFEVHNTNTVKIDSDVRKEPNQGFLCYFKRGHFTNEIKVVLFVFFESMGLVFWSFFCDLHLVDK